MSLSIEDRLAILDLTAQASLLIDLGEAEAWAKTYTPDGYFEPGPIKGWEALTKFAAGYHERLPRGRHLVNNSYIEGDGDRATHTAFMTLVDQGAEGGPKIVGGGVYRDTLRKIDGRWKFTVRSMTSDTRRA